MDVVVKYCHTCVDTTPHTSQTSGFICHCCLNQSHQISAVSAVSAEWLAAFWQRKYYELKNFVPGTITIVSSLSSASGTLHIANFNSINKEKKT